MKDLYAQTVRGLLESVGVEALPGEKVQLKVGDKLRVNASIDYKGPALSDTFYAAIGVRGVGFDEILVGQSVVSFPQSADFVTYNLSADITITTAIAAKTDYDLYVKLVNHETEAGRPEVDNVIDIVSAMAFQNFKITGYNKV